MHALLRGALLCLGALALLALTGGPALAKGPPSRATIGGPGLPDVVVITDPGILDVLAWPYAADEAVAWPREAAPRLTAGYELVRSWGDPPVSVERLRYFPDPAGGRGYAWNAADGRWFRVSADAEAALRRLLAGHGAPPTGRAQPTPAPWMAAPVGAAVLAVWMLGRRRRAGGKR